MAGRTEPELVALLQKHFPKGTIYKDEYQVLLPSLPSREIFLAAKSRGMSSVEWLKACGFAWEEDRYIEADMRFPAKLAEPPETAEELACYILENYALIGEFPLDMDGAPAKALFERAKQAFDQILSRNQLDLNRQSVLVVETVFLLKKWDGGLGRAHEDNSLWRYIYLQYGFNPENSQVGEQQVYGAFCDAIKNVMKHYGRYMAPKGTQRYYTTLMLHALAPKQSIFALFNLLFAFYSKSLDYQVIPNDPSFAAFTASVAARWDSEQDGGAGVEIRSDVLASGLRVLFLNRPHYTAYLCERLTEQMDALLRAQRDESTRTFDSWMVLLDEWYFEKSSAVRSGWRASRRTSTSDMIATSKTTIHIRYQLIKEDVCLILPRIRFVQPLESRPTVSVFQNGGCTFSKPLTIQSIEEGICFTTALEVLPLESLSLDGSVNFEWNLLIQLGDETFYSSDNKLNRDYIVFDSNGNERNIQGPDNADIHLFAPQHTKVELDEDTTYYQVKHIGQLLAIHLNTSSALIVGGRELCVDQDRKDSFRLYPSESKCIGLSALINGEDYDIFPSTFHLIANLPQGAHSGQYHISINGRTVPLADRNAGDGIKLDIPAEPQKPNEIRVIDFTANREVCCFRYVILPGCTLIFDQPVYPDNGQVFHATISYAENILEVDGRIDAQTNRFQVVSADISMDFEIVLPIVRCRFLDGNGFDAPPAIWHAIVPQTEFVSIEVPSKWRGMLMLGANAVPLASGRNWFELGNHIRSSPFSGKALPLWISVTGPSEQKEKWKLTDIAFKEHFIEPPLYIEMGKLCWSSAENYVGPLVNIFHVTIYGPADTQTKYDAPQAAGVLCDLFPYRAGLFPYRVEIDRRTAFTSARVLVCEGELVVGDPNQVRFARKQLSLNAAQCWDFGKEVLETAMMRYESAIIDRMEYQGESIANGETVQAPEYIARMCFRNLNNGNLVPFSSNDSEKFQCINPVRIWVVNEFLLIVTAGTEDGLYLDTRTGTILNQNPDYNMTKEEQKQYLKTPDYYEYTIR